MRSKGFNSKEFNKEINDQRDKDFDIFLGKQLKERRVRRKMTLMGVAEQVGISYQQIQKYETATSKISAHLLYKLANLYCVPIEQLFSGFQNKDKFSTTIFREIPRIFNILIVEDNPGDEAITRHALKDMNNLNILCVHDGAQTMNVLRYKTLCTDFPRPDLILLDVYLPKRNGLMILKDIKRDKAYEDIPIVILTNNVSSKIMVSAYKYGASGYISKSFDFEEFKENIVNCVKYWSSSVVLPSRIKKDFNTE